MRENYYADPQDRNPLPVIPIRNCILNPFQKDRIEMSVLPGFMLPWETMKYVAAFEMLRSAKEHGIFQPGDVLVEATSGRTGLALVRHALAEPFNASGVVLVMKQDVPLAKRNAPLFAGGKIIPPETGISPIATARKRGGGGWRPDGGWQKGEDDCLNLDQYANPSNPAGYEKYLAPGALDQIHDCNVLVSPLGTGGTLIGFSNYFRNRLAVTVVAAQCAPGEEIPGVRDLANMREITLPWQAALDETVDVTTRQAYVTSLWGDWTMGLPMGPSSGLTIFAGLKFVKKLKDTGRLDSVRGKNGTIQMLLVLHDSSSPYLVDRYPAFLPAEWQNPSTAPRPIDLLL